MTVREAFERRDLDGLAALIDERVVWVGLLPGQLCRNRQEVLDTFEAALATGVNASPEILAETDEVLVIDPHVEPPPEHVPELHQVFVLEEGRVVELRDYPDRSSALEAAGLS
jgi:ketosteroid isomerase-like protein